MRPDLFLGLDSNVKIAKKVEGQITKEDGGADLHVALTETPWKATIPVRQVCRSVDLCIYYDVGTYLLACSY